MSLTSEIGGAAKAMGQAYQQHRGFYLAVSRARERGDSLFYVKAPNGTTLDLCVTRQEARKIAAQEIGARVYELRGHHQRLLVNP